MNGRDFRQVAINDMDGKIESFLNHQIQNRRQSAGKVR